MDPDGDLDGEGRRLLGVCSGLNADPDQSVVAPTSSEDPGDNGLMGNMTVESGSGGNPADLDGDPDAESPRLHGVCSRRRPPPRRPSVPADLCRRAAEQVREAKVSPHGGLDEEGGAEDEDDG